MKISVIVPVFNCENTLRTCVNSLLDQDFDDYEIILVDDGSEDDSGAICDDYHNECEKIRVVHKTNGGVSSACNFGIDYARGKYIMFCDADDYAEPDWMKLLYNAVEVNPDDSVFCSFYRATARKNRSVSLSARGGRIELSKYYMLYTEGFAAPRWNRIYRRDVIGSDLRFDESISVGEDALFNIGYIKRCKHFYYITSPLYHWYDDGDNSLSRAFNAKQYDVIKVLYFPRLEVIDKKDRQKYYNLSLYNFYKSIENVFDKRSEMTYEEQREYAKYILHDDVFSDALKHANTSLKVLLKPRSRRLILAYIKLRKKFKGK